MNNLYQRVLINRIKKPREYRANANEIHVSYAVLNAPPLLFLARLSFIVRGIRAVSKLHSRNVTGATRVH
jgi:hypothetical protein